MIFYTVLQLFTPRKLQDEMRREDFLENSHPHI